MIMMHLPKAVHTCNVMIYRYLQYHLLNLLLVFVQCSDCMLSIQLVPERWSRLGQVGMYCISQAQSRASCNWFLRGILYLQGTFNSNVL